MDDEYYQPERGIGYWAARVTPWWLVGGAVALALACIAAGPLAVTVGVPHWYAVGLVWLLAAWLFGSILGAALAAFFVRPW